jgi:AcrR family transcriptional regulator
MTEIEVSRRERKKEETRERIFKVAVKLFRDRGFEATTVDDITERADVAKGTFFNYFPRKEAVLAYLSEKRLVAAEENAEAILAAPRSARDKLIELYGSAASAYAEDRELSRFVLNELMARAFAPSDEQGHGPRWRGLVTRMFEQGKSAGEFRADLDPARAEAVLTGVYYALIYTWANCLQAEINLQEELRAQLDLVFDGLAA